MPSMRMIRFAIFDTYSRAGGEIEPVVIKMPFVAATPSKTPRKGLDLRSPHYISRPVSLRLDIDAVEPECVFVDNSVYASVPWPSDCLSSFRLAAPIPEFAQQIYDEFLE